MKRARKPKAVPTLAPAPRVNDSKMDAVDRMQFCIRNVNSLRKEHREEVLELLILRLGSRKNIYQSGDACRIDLDLVPPEIVDALYNLIKSRLEQ